MRLAIFTYLLTMMFLWEIVGSYSRSHRGYPEELSYAEAALWGRNNAFTLIGLLLGQVLWVFGLAYPIYWAVTQSVTQALILLFGGNLALIVVTSLAKRMFAIPGVILAYIGIVVAPFLMLGIWFIRV